MTEKSIRLGRINRWGIASSGASLVIMLASPVLKTVFDSEKASSGGLIAAGIFLAISLALIPYRRYVERQQ